MEAKRLVQLKATHRRFICLEKTKYYKHRKKGRDPNKVLPATTKRKYLSVIFDGMDQAKTAVIKQARSAKHLDGCYKHNVHVMGILTHGSDQPCEVIISDASLPHDTNFALTVLCSTLKRFKDRNGYLPPTLYLQLDSAPENKSKNFMLFIAVLVGIGTFNKVKLCFLPVGHTHEDIDQMFSRFGVAFRKSDILTYEDLIKLMGGAFHFENKELEINRLLQTWDFGGWMADVMPDMVGISEPMCFKFIRDEEEQTVRMFAREMMQTSKRAHPDCWFPDGGYPVLSFSDANNLLEDDVIGVPIRPLDPLPIQASVNTFKIHGVMKADHLESWQVELDRIIASADDQCDVCVSFRVSESQTNSTKADEPAVATAKKTARTKLQKEIRAHSADPDFFAVHMHADPKDIIPLETDFDELAGVGVSDNSDSDIEGADNVEFRQFKRSATSSRMVKGVLVPRDVRKLTVGKVAAHWRIMLTPMTIGDFVAFRYKEEKSSSDLDDSDPDTDDEDIGDLLGVGQVLAILSDNRYTIRWHGPKDPKASQNLRLGAALFPGYYQATEKREPYYDTSPIKKHDDEMIEDMLLYEEAIIIHGFKLTTIQRKLPLKIQRRICGVAVLPHRIKGHAAKCECMAE